MSVFITNFEEFDNRLTFTISGIDLSYANALRRTIISDIPTLVFRTSPYEKNKCNIISNTGRLNNELVKQRLSCIPICIPDEKLFNHFINNYELELNVENNTDEIIIVTTKDFRIKSLTNNTYLDESKTQTIFPPYIDPVGNNPYFIQFLRLRPRISDEIPGEKIHLTCRFDVGTAREDGMFNVAGTCSYRRTPNTNGQEIELRKQIQMWTDKGLSDKEIEFERKNWLLLEGMRITTENSFDFVLEGIGIYDTIILFTKACTILRHGLDMLINDLENGNINIEESNNTKPNCFLIYFENKENVSNQDQEQEQINDGEETKGEETKKLERDSNTNKGYVVDYTLGNIINHEMYENYFKSNKIHSVAIKKLHPHDDYITMEVSVVESQNAKENLIAMLSESCKKGKNTIKAIMKTYTNYIMSHKK
jgi:DNA-directed RNA polymerase subunit L